MRHLAGRDGDSRNLDDRRRAGRNRDRLREPVRVGDHDLAWIDELVNFGGGRNGATCDRQRAFRRRNWWQVILLVLPFLRILRLGRAARLLRTGRVLSSAVRSTRTARRVLGGRVAWLAARSAIVMLGSSQLLYGFSDFAT